MIWPAQSSARDRFVLDHRPAGMRPNPWGEPPFLLEEEEGPDGLPVKTLAIFLVGRECPWRCAMCDLWTQTIEEDTPPGALGHQIAAARAATSQHRSRQVKLYNAGSFFDPRAVPEADYPDLARRLQPFERVVVESHPALIGPRLDAFLEALRGAADPGQPPALEVAMGLETVHPAALDRLNKRMDLTMFAAAARSLRDRGVALRAFVLIAPPFVPAEEQDHWLLESLTFALDCGASVISLIPTRSGNGTMEVLEGRGLFTPPSRDTVTRSAGLARARVGTRARLFLDPWSDA